MKKVFTMILMLLLLSTVCAQAESTVSVYDELGGLMNGRTFTLTVTAESEADELAALIEQFGTMTCVLHQENNEIKLDASCDGAAYLKAAATKEGIRFETNLIENGTFYSDWAALTPVITHEAGTLSVTLTGPDHELIRFTCKVSGDAIDDCQAEIDIGYITGPGNVHSLWDGITNKGGETSREFFFTFSEEEYGMEGEGTSAAETAEDGSITISREENCILTYQEDELGEITFRSVLNIQ